MEQFYVSFTDNIKIKNVFTGDYFITQVQTRLEKRQLGQLIPHYIDDRRHELKSNCLMTATFLDVIQLTI